MFVLLVRGPVFVLLGLAYRAVMMERERESAFSDGSVHAPPTIHASIGPTPELCRTHTHPPYSPTPELSKNFLRQFRRWIFPAHFYGRGGLERAEGGLQLERGKQMCATYLQPGKTFLASNLCLQDLLRDGDG